MNMNGLDLRYLHYCFATNSVSMIIKGFLPFRKFSEDRKWKKQMIEWSTLWQEIFLVKLVALKHAFGNYYPYSSLSKFLNHCFRTAFHQERHALDTIHGSVFVCWVCFETHARVFGSLGYVFVRFVLAVCLFYIYEFNWTCIEVY